MADTKKEEDKKKKEEEERKKIYTPYWQQENPNEHRLSDDTPDVHVYISQQLRGTEDATKPYSTQIEKDTKKEKTTADEKTNSANTSTPETTNT